MSVRSHFGSSPVETPARDPCRPGLGQGICARWNDARIAAARHVLQRRLPLQSRSMPTHTVPITQAAPNGNCSAACAPTLAAGPSFQNSVRQLGWAPCASAISGANAGPFNLGRNRRSNPAPCPCASVSRNACTRTRCPDRPASLSLANAHDVPRGKTATA